MNGSLDLLKSFGFTAVSIPLSKAEGWTVIDIDDAPIILRHRWYIQRKSKTLQYAKSKPGELHHYLLGDSECIVDHRDGDGLNNRRCNLRQCDNRLNQGNAKRRADNASGYRGVSYYAGKWQAHIRRSGQKIYLGRFANVEEAARAYDAAARATFGEFAATNFPTETH